MASTPSVPAPGVVRGMVRFFDETGYTQAAMKEHGLTEVPWRGSAGEAVLDHKIPRNPALALLIRLFHFGEPADSRIVSSILPAAAVNDMIACGMLQPRDQSFEPGCMLGHFGGLLLASDSVRRLQTGDTADLVLGANPTTTVLAHCFIRRQDAEALDLGAGCGVLSLLLAPSCRSVTASDVNPRALSFTGFNAALNGISNVSLVSGDRFEAVEGRRFDLIVSNPPFFLTPEPRLLFSDNPLELDSFVESVIASAPAFLKEGGYFQLTCEWVEHASEPWKQRLERWFAHSGCDTLLWKAYEIAPVDYILKRAAEAAPMFPEENNPDWLRKQVDYFERKHVVKILGGMVTMRRRDAKNWTALEAGEAPSEPVGEFLAGQFATRDTLASYEGEKLLTTRPCVSKGVRLVREAILEGQSWKQTRVYVERSGSLTRRLAFESDIADLMARCDGTRTLSAIARDITRRAGFPEKNISENVLKIVRNLALRGFIEFPHS